ncbi:hypothetical protein [Sphingobium aquiterrae]|uniref:hypothetical protein n=1 Tax=Sphingobium aquiterrae TaxID=2038656 RepID=UPI003017E994
MTGEGGSAEDGAGADRAVVALVARLIGMDLPEAAVAGVAANLALLGAHLARLDGFGPEDVG